MPSAKQYELLFALKAQLDATFTNGFGTAKTYVAGLQQEVNTYNQQLRDISAYNTHSAKLQSLIQEYGQEQEKLQLIQQLIQTNGGETQELTATKEAQERVMRRLATQIGEVNAKLDEDKNKLDEDGISVNNLTQAERELQEQLEQTNTELEGWQTAQDTVSSLATNLNAIAPIVNVATEAAKSFLGAIGECIDSSAELEYTMSAVKAVSGATEEETETLSGLANQLGADTIYTAAEVASALETMGLAGATAEEMISGIPAVIHLAAAAGEDLTEMTGIVMDGMNAFGLEGEAAMNKFADVLANTATSSNTTVSVLGESLSYVEATAANLGYSVEDVSLALAQMANNSLKGSVSGSALNTMLTRMSGANSNAAKAMDELNLSMYDSSGEAKSLSTFLGELREKFQNGSMSAQEMQIAAYKLAGQRGMRGLLSIVNASEEEWQNLTEEIYDYEGAAEEISNIRLDNYSGQVELLSGAVDSLKISVGDKFLPAATGVAAVLEKIVTAIDLFVQNSGPVVPLLAGAAAGLATLGTVLGVATLATNALSAAMTTLGLAAGPLGWIALGVGAVGAAAAGIAYSAAGTDTLDESIRQLKTDTDGLGESTQSILEDYETTSQKYDEQRESVENLTGVLEDLQKQDQDSATTQEQTKEVVSQLNELLPDLGLEYDEVSGKINKTTDEILKMNSAMSEEEVQAYYEKLVDMRAQAEELEKKIALAKEEAANAKPTYSAGYGNSFIADNSNVAAANQAVSDLEQQYDDLKDSIGELEEKTAGYQAQLEEQAEAAGMTTTELDTLNTAVANYASVWEEAYTSAYESLWGTVSMTDEAAEAEEISLSEMSKNLQTHIDAYKKYNEDLQTILDAGLEIPDNIWSELTSGTAEARGEVESIAQGLKDNNTEMIQQLQDQWKQLDDGIGETANTISQGTGEVQEAFQTVVDSLGNVDTEAAKEKASETGKQVIAGLLVGLNDEEGKLVTVSGEQADKLINNLNDKLGVHSPSTITTKTGKYVIQGLEEGMINEKQTLLDKIKDITTAAKQKFNTELSKNKFEIYGKNAIQGAIDGAEGMRQSLIDKFTSLGTAAAQAYADAQSIESPSKVFKYYSEMDIQGAINGLQENEDALTAASASAGNAAADAYIESKGEQIEAFSINPAVYPAIESISAEREGAKIAFGSGGGNSYEIKVNYAPTVNGDSTSIDKQLRENAAELRTMIKEVVYEIQDDEDRRAY